MQSMKIAYITRTNLSSNAAQARQVSAMARAFSSQLDKNFFFIAAANSNHELAFKWLRLKNTYNEKIRYSVACLLSAYAVILKRQRVVFTRDIAVAFTTVFSGGRAVYEAHLALTNPIAKALLKLISCSSRFRLVAISNGIAKYYMSNYNLKNEKVFKL